MQILHGHTSPLVSSLLAGPPSATVIRNPLRPRTPLQIPKPPFQSFSESSEHSPSSKFSVLSTNSSDSVTSSVDDDGVDDGDGGYFCDADLCGIEIEIEKISKNCRRIRSKVAVEASLQTVWNILTDYERLADFIPGLAVSEVVERRDKFARLFQIGQQNLAFGLKFNAKGVVDCYEKDLENLPSSQRRDIEFNMIDGDFELFEGKWSIEQCSAGGNKPSGSLVSQGFHTTLTYVVDVKPKMWLPVQLVEGRLCREIEMNLSCIRKEAQKASHDRFPAN